MGLLFLTCCKKSAQTLQLATFLSNHDSLFVGLNTIQSALPRNHAWYFTVSVSFDKHMVKHIKFRLCIDIFWMLI